MNTLYVSDVDGTLYRGGLEGLRESSRLLFQQILSQGTLLTVASGRNLHGVFDLAQDAGITLPVIAYNGAAIYDFVRGKAVATFPIEPQNAERIFALFDHLKIPYQTCVFREEEERCIGYLQNGYRTRHCQERLEHIRLGCERSLHPKNGLVYDEPVFDAGPEQLLEGQCLYIGSAGSYQPIAAIYEQVRSLPGVSAVMHCSPYSPDRWFVDIGSDQAGKGKAALYLKELLGAEELVTFGDNHNDVPMLCAASRSYVVPEAPEEVKRAATAVLPEGDDCVLEWILQEIRPTGKTAATF